MDPKSVVVLLCVSFATIACLDWPCKTEEGVDFIGHITDCGSYFICEDGKATKMFCPPKFVYHGASRTCVPEDSSPDINCDNRPTPYEHLYCGTNSTDQVADPKSCARYFNCSAEKNGQFEDPFLRECPYPELWSAEAEDCVNPSYTGCADRPVPIDKCEYLAHQCLTARCAPCRSRYASCKGLVDGLNAWPGLEGSSRYIFCINQRLQHGGFCKIHYGEPTKFDPALKKCVYAVPLDRGDRGQL